MFEVYEMLPLVYWQTVTGTAKEFIRFIFRIKQFNKFL
jgi:hypothetical protein